MIATVIEYTQGNGIRKLRVLDPYNLIITLDKDRREIGVENLVKFHAFSPRGEWRVVGDVEVSESILDVFQRYAAIRKELADVAPELSSLALSVARI